MKIFSFLAGALLLLALTTGCEVSAPYGGGGYAGVYGEYPSTYTSEYYVFPPTHIITLPYIIRGVATTILATVPTITTELVTSATMSTITRKSEPTVAEFEIINRPRNITDRCFLFP
jgi:hypothetical protein